MPLHGIDYKEIQAGPLTVTEVPSGIGFLVGSAPKGPIETPTLVRSPGEAAQFGLEIPGFTIPQALASWFAEGGGSVIVQNVFNPANDTTAVPTENITLVAGKGKTANPPVSALVVKHSSGTPVYVKGTDYTADDYGNITSINNTTIAQTATIQVSYNKQNLTAIDASDIIGSVDGTTGVRKGLEAIDDAPALFGYKAKIIFAPGYSHLTGVSTKMLTKAKENFAVALIDAPSGTTVPVAIAGRGPAGTIAAFRADDTRGILVHGWMKSYDPASNAVVAKPHSQYYAGLIARTDRDYGFHFAPSNYPYNSVTGYDVVISSSAFDITKDNQLLNQAGIVSILNEGRGGIKAWGLRNSSSEIGSIMNFITSRRIIDIAVESIMLATVPYVGRPMTVGLREQIRESANNYLKSLVGRGALVDAECVYEPAKNPTSELNVGHWTFTIRWVPTPPAEHITYETYIDVSLLEALNQTT